MLVMGYTSEIKVLYYETFLIILFTMFLSFSFQVYINDLDLYLNEAKMGYSKNNHTLRWM